ENETGQGRTALGRAALNGDVETVARLLEAGARIDHAEADGRPPIVLAALSGSPEVVGLLLAAGADPDARERNTGNTPLMLAANNGHLDVVRLLLDRGVDVNARSEDGWTALEAAEMIGDSEIAAQLRAAGAKN
ncbi:MAG TPA: ankyrin repeat domain-containing protein, partial [Kiloniellales bacterium]|nr:ankyrin repeat domain-containing protein [Kiloniellales bacterium]